MNLAFNNCKFLSSTVRVFELYKRRSDIAPLDVLVGNKKESTNPLHVCAPIC